jgi:hypothetical protein
MNARTFSLIIGIAFLAAGVLGFVPAVVSPPPDTAPAVGITAFHGYLLGLFPVNFMHNLVHIAIGAWGISASQSMGGAQAYSKVLALFYGALAVMGLIPALNTMFGLVPIHGHDVWLHGGTAILAAYFGWIWKADSGQAKAAAH